MWAAAALLAAAAPSPSVAYNLDPSIRLIEGIASDGRTIYLSSPTERVIFACRKRCERQIEFSGEEVVPMGIAWDPRRKQLWVTLSCPKPITPGSCEHGALRALDAKGRLRAQVVPTEGGFKVGDVSASGDGTVLVSNSESGEVFQLTGNEDLVPVLAAYEGKSAQGSALLADGRLLLADYSRGITAVDRKTGARTLLLRNDGKPVRGIDGMAVTGGRIFAIYNGDEPGAVLELNVDGTSIAYKVIAQGGPLKDLTQIAVQGSDLIVVADAGWTDIDKPARQGSGSHVIRIPIPPRD